ncbi:cytochrome c oxidase subunit VA-domain-containing protein [Phyllosticta capitalensis]|uniref:Cytochrome c oxidase subunit 6, mitochondrial n=1 Tax=Phyllosticta capitalensis TaxID=121624 RepID=A0ABR1YIV0_9PEZI
MAASVFRLAARRAPVFRARAAAAPMSSRFARTFSTTVPRFSGDHHEESFEEFTARYEKEFDSVQDAFELQRNLNNAFAYDLVPAPSVITAALKAARRVNDFPTAVRIFEGIKSKVENKGQYEEYLKELEPLREELGIVLKEKLYPEDA